MYDIVIYGYHNFYIIKYGIKIKMGLLKKQEVKKLIISPNEFHISEIKRLNNSNISNMDEDLLIKSKPDVNILANIPILATNPTEEYVIYSDGIQQKITKLEDLPKFEVKPGMRVKIPSNKGMIKCPFKCREAPNGKRYFNLIAFTQNIVSESCCGVTYFK